MGRRFGYASTVLFRAMRWSGMSPSAPTARTWRFSYQDRTVAVLAMADKHVVCPLSQSEGDSSNSFPSLAFGRDEQTLAVGEESASDANALTIWDVSTCRQTGGGIETTKPAGCPRRTRTMYAASRSDPDGKQLAVGLGDSMLVIDPTTRKVVRDAIVFHANYPVTSIAYSPDSSRVAVGLATRPLSSSTPPPVRPSASP